MIKGSKYPNLWKKSILEKGASLCQSPKLRVNLELLWGIRKEQAKKKCGSI